MTPEDQMFRGPLFGDDPADRMDSSLPDRGVGDAPPRAKTPLADFTDSRFRRGTTPVEAISDMYTQDDGRTGLAFEVGRQLDAGKASRILALSAQTGLPAEFIRENVEEVEAQVARPDFNPSAFRQQSPAVAKWVDGSPERAALVAPDLTSWEKTEAFFSDMNKQAQAGSEWLDRKTKGVFRDTAAGVTEIPAMTFQGGATAIRNTSRAMRDLTYMITPQWMIDIDRAISGAVEPFIDITAGMDVVGGGWRGITDLVQATPEERSIVSSIGRGVGQLAGQVGVAVASGGATTATSATMLLTMGADIQRQKIEEARKRGVTVSEQQEQAAIALGALSTWGTETIGMKWLMDRLPPQMKSAMLSRMGDVILAGLGEGSQEITDQVMQELIEKGIYDPTNKIFKWAELGEEGLVGFGAGAIARFALGAMGVSARAMGSEATRQRVGDLEQRLSGIKTKTEAPDVYEDLVRGLGREYGVESMFVDLAGFQAYFQSVGKDPAAAAAEITGDPNAYVEASATGGRLEIPIEKYARNVVDTDASAGLRDYLAFTADGPTAADLADTETRQAEIEELFRAATESGTMDDALALKDEVLGSLLRIYPRDVAEQIAEGYSRTLGILAQRAGKTPEELYRANPVQWERLTPEVLTRMSSVDTVIDPLIDELRSGRRPTQDDIFGKSLLDFIRERGGLQDAGGELARMDLKLERKPGQTSLVQQETGKELDMAAEAAAEAGYIGEASINALLEAVETEMMGRKVYRVGGENQQLLRRQMDLDSLERQLESMGADVATMNNEQIKRLLRGESDAGAVDAAREIGGDRSLLQRIGDTVSGLFRGDQAQVVDSEGQAVGQTPEAQGEFAKWFEGSLAVDDQGRPLRLFHGTNADGVAAINPGRVSSIFMTPDQEHAGRYGQNMLTVYLQSKAMADLTNPNDPGYQAAVAAFNEAGGWAADEDAWAMLQEEGETNPLFDPARDLTWEIYDHPAMGVSLALRDAGYDSAKLDEGDGDISYAAFDPSQVRVARSGDTVLFQDAAIDMDAAQALLSAVTLPGALAVARSREFATNRDLKLVMQNAALQSAAQAKINLDETRPQAQALLEEAMFLDAMQSLRTHSNAVGWYNRKVRAALAVSALVHPEIATDPRAKFAFIYALAVLSNGQKVNKNFELAEQAYRHFKRTGKMPTNIGVGKPANAINAAMKAFNKLWKSMGPDAFQAMMLSKKTVKEWNALSPGGLSVTGEAVGVETFGAAVLGAKIGNGFFMNLYGEFGQLTMDRWYVRTWGRYIGRLVENNKPLIAKHRARLVAAIESLTENQRREFEKIIGGRLNKQETARSAALIARATANKENRERMEKLGARTEELRKAGNGLNGSLDGQIEAPKQWQRPIMRAVTGRVLERMRAVAPALTMADLQAILWYAEKSLYETAAVADSDQDDSYDDDNAPDYANAAVAMAVENGVPIERARETARKAEREADTAAGLAGAPRPADAGVQRDGPGGDASGRGEDVPERGTTTLYQGADERELIVQHNLSEDNLMHAARMGGIPVPSLAVTKASNPLSGFGEITLLGTKELADPKGYARTRVFGADIYSPRYPKVDVRLDRGALEQLNRLLAPFRKEGERQIYSSDITSVNDLADHPAFIAYAVQEFGSTNHIARRATRMLEFLGGVEERIFKGFTNSGNRRYIPHTLENVVRILKKELRGGEGFNYGAGSLRARFTPQFKSLEQIRKNKHRLISDSEFDTIKTEVNDELYAIASDLWETNPVPLSSVQGPTDTAIAVMEDAARMGMQKALATYGFTNVPAELSNRIAAFMQKLANMPTAYFEAKIMREVDVAEFRAAVVPPTISPEARSYLESRGLVVVEYDRSRGEAGRAHAIKELTASDPNNLLFQETSTTGGPTFYSVALRVAEASESKSLTAQQWLNAMKRAGVTSSELEWTGVDGWLDWRKRDGAQISKELLVQFLEANQITIDQVELRKEMTSVVVDSQPLTSIKGDLTAPIDVGNEELNNKLMAVMAALVDSHAWDRVMNRADAGSLTHLDENEKALIIRKIGRGVSRANASIPATEKEFFEVRIVGSLNTSWTETSRDDAEFLIEFPAGPDSYPEVSLVVSSDEVDELVKAETRLEHEARSRDALETADPRMERRTGTEYGRYLPLRLPLKAGKSYTETLVLLPEGIMGREDIEFESSHFTLPDEEKNRLLGWHRTDSGIVFLGDGRAEDASIVFELQSDWAQAGREKGFRGEEEVEQEPKVVTSIHEIRWSVDYFQGPTEEERRLAAQELLELMERLDVVVATKEAEYLRAQANVIGYPPSATVKLLHKARIDAYAAAKKDLETVFYKVQSSEPIMAADVNSALDATVFVFGTADGGSIYYTRWMQESFRDRRYAANVLFPGLTRDQTVREATQELLEARILEIWNDTSRIQWAVRNQQKVRDTPPLAPFVGDSSDWMRLLLKSAIRQAVLAGKDGIALATADMQVSLWGTEEITWEAAGDGQFRMTAKMQKGGEAGGIDLEARARERGLISASYAMVDPSDINSVVSGIRDGITRDAMTDEKVLALAEKVATKMQASHTGVYMPRYEGMKQGYDKTAASILKKLAAKSGAEFMTGELGSLKPNVNPKVPYLKFNDEIRRLAMEGQPLFQQQTLEDSRGAIEFGTRNAQGIRAFRILLTEKANLSTALHELGHYWFEIMADLAAEGGSESIVRDYQTMLRFVGKTDRSQVVREDHEKMARAFEAYLMEGRAPSVQAAGTFARFRSWLIQVYKSLGELRVDLNEELREVFDRMVATDEEINAVRAAERMGPLFKDAQSAGMTDEEFAAYKRATDEAQQSGVTALMKEMMAVKLRESKAWYRKLKLKVEREVQDEVDRQPVYQALAYLQFGRIYNGPDLDKDQRVKLSKAALVDAYGEAFLKRLPRPYIYSAEGGMHQDFVADMFGFSSGDAMIQAVVNARPRKALVKAETESRMREMYPDPMLDGDISAEAENASFNDRQAELLGRELKALEAQSGRSKPTTLQVLRATAKRIIDSKPVRRIDANRYRVAAASAARQTEQALLRGDFETARQQKRTQLLNHVMYQEAQKARETVESIAKYLRKFTSKKVQQRLGKSGGDYLDQIQAIIERYELGKISNRVLQRRESLRQFVERMEDEGQNIGIEQAVIDEARQVNYRDVPVSELVGARDAVRQIEHLARRKLYFKTRAQRKEWEKVKYELIAAAKQLKGKPPRIDPETRKMWDRFKDRVDSIDGSLIKMEQLVRWLDSENIDGPWQQYLWADIEAAQFEKTKVMEEKLGTLRDALHRMSKEGRVRSGDLVEIKSLGTSVTRGFLMGVALNTGTDSNYQRLTSPANFTQPQIDEMLGLLTREELELVQTVWDTFDSLWPEIAAMEERLNGIAPPKQEARRVELSVMEGGVRVPVSLRGGYFPLVYDPKKSPAGMKQEGERMRTSGPFETGYVFGSTPKGHTKERVKNFDAALKISLSVITQRLSRHIHDLTHREAVLNAHKILSDTEIRAAVREALGEGAEASMYPWLKRVANDGAADVMDGIEGMREIAEKLRANTTIAIMGLKITTMMSQFAGYADVAEMIGSKWLAVGMKEFYKNPKAAWRYAELKSGEIKDRFLNKDLSVREQLETLRGRRDLRAQSVRFFFSNILVADKIVATAGWIGAYQKAISEGRSEESAIAYANSVVRLTQGASATKDLAAVQATNNQLFKWLGMFYSYFNAKYSRIRSMGRRGRRVARGEFKELPLLLAQVMWGTFLPAILGEILAGRGPDDDDNWAAWTLQTWFEFPFMTVIGLRDIVRPVVAGLGGKETMFAPEFQLTPVATVGTAATQFGLETIDLASGDGDIADWAGAVFKAGGYLVGYPVSQPRITGKALIEMAEGDTPDNVLEFLDRVSFAQKR